MTGTRCSGCDGKFGASGEPEVEVDSFDVSDTSLTADIQLNIPCANCGSELKQGSLSFETELDAEEHDGECEISDPDTGQPVTLESDEDRFRELADSDRFFEISDVDAQVSDDYRPSTMTKTLKDGTVKTKTVPMRYRTHYYDVTVTFSVRCAACGSDMEVIAEDSLSASELEEAG
jgi:hypothetical protein